MESHSSLLQECQQRKCYIRLEQCVQSHISKGSPVDQTLVDLPESTVEPVVIKNEPSNQLQSDGNAIIDDDIVSHDDNFSWFDVIKAECADDESSIAMDASPPFTVKAESVAPELNFTSDSDDNHLVVVDEVSAPVTGDILFDGSDEEHDTTNSDPLTHLFSSCKPEIFQIVLLLQHCPYCNNVVTNASELFNHIAQVHATYASYTCSHVDCDASFTSVGVLLEHLINAHLSDLKLGCVICGSGIATVQQAKCHIDDHSAACLLCGMDYKHFYLLEDHIAQDHQDADGNFSCSLCDYRVSNVKKSLQMFLHHIRLHYGIENCRCKFCEFRWFRSREHLIAHLKKVHQFSDAQQCPQCLEYETTNVYAMALHWRNGCSSLRCDLCKAAYFTSSSSLYRHKKLCGQNAQQDELPFHCDRCIAQFRSKQHLKAHIIARHDKSMGLSCTVRDCSFIATTKQKFEQHIYRVHSISDGVSEANKNASTNAALNGIEQVLICHFPQCEFSAIERDILKDHVEMEHVPESASLRAKRKYLCDSCGYVFKAHNILRRHKISSHNARSNYFCSSCDIHFHDSYYYQLHVEQFHEKCVKVLIQDFKATENLLVREEKPTPPPLTGDFRCDKCSYHTGSHQRFLIHQSAMVHKGKAVVRTPRTFKPEKCPLCDFITHRNSCSKALQRHLFVHYRRGEKIPEGYVPSVCECKLCDHITCDETHLRRHLKVHINRGELLSPSYNVLNTHYFK